MRELVAGRDGAGGSDAWWEDGAKNTPGYYGTREPWPGHGAEHVGRGRALFYDADDWWWTGAQARRRLRSGPMKVSHKEPKTTEVEVIDDILCNQCGESCKQTLNFEGLLEAHVQGGYGAKLGDMDSYIFSICEDCLSTLFDGFKHPPATSNVMASEG